jgi:DNA processing protein
MGPRTLFELLERDEPSDAWARIVRGEVSNDSGWRLQAGRTDVGVVWASHRERGVGVLWSRGPGFPAALASDIDAPGVVFYLGDPSVLEPRPRVALVGTRSATRYGLGVAAQFGADLSAAGVSVVSGLALGIDGAAHEGACAPRPGNGDGWAPPVAVVAGGLDKPYPARHASLWRRLTEIGVVLSTSPVRTPVDRWRFPQRNRLIAALAHVIVVVESHHAGGSLITAREGERRGLLVGAVPGSIRSPSSSGTNDLLADGCFPVRDVTDIETALGLMLAGRPVERTRRRAVPTAKGSAEGARAANAVALPANVQEQLELGPAPVDDPTSKVLDALAGDRCSVDQLLRRTGLDLPELCLVLEHLRADGRVLEDGGWWEDG